MLALIQRVTEASVVVDGEIVGAIDAGLLAFVGMEPGDTDAQIARMAERLLGYRVFEDAQGKMNRSGSRTPGAACCWSASSPWPRTPDRACAPASARPRRPKSLNPASTDWSNLAANGMREGWKPAGSVPI